MWYYTADTFLIRGTPIIFKLFFFLFIMVGQSKSCWTFKNTQDTSHLKGSNSMLSGSYSRGKKKLYYLFDRDENLHTSVKLTTKWGNCQELFSILFIENELFTENLKNGIRSNEPNGRTVQLTQLILLSIEAESCALQNYRVSFRISF